VQLERRNTDLGRRQHGMTVAEIMIALAVIGLASIVGYMSLRRVRQSDLRENTTEVAATLKNAHVMAMQTGVHHRVVFDLEKQVYQIQACEGKVRLAKTEEEQLPTPEDEEKIAETVKRLQLPADSTMQTEVFGASSPEEATKLALALQGSSVGTAQCGPPKLNNGKLDRRGDPRSMKKGLKVKQVYVQHLESPATTGVVTINFFPLGYAEKAVIEVGDDDDEHHYSLLVHGLTGRIEFRSGKLDDPDRHMRRNAAGDTVDER
jgi:prepilin-type N-terminal cleavage/methylation domain-containing protein